MVHIEIIRKIVGFSFKGAGLFWAFSDKFLCTNFCKDTCTIAQNQTCSFLFLFVAIIFIVCGYALIVMKDKTRRKLKTKIKKAIKSVK